jgi:hypothetical protein
LKQYGLILADGGSGWAVRIEYAKWPKAAIDAFSEISQQNVIDPSNFEAVDESGLEDFVNFWRDYCKSGNRNVHTFVRQCNCQHGYLSREPRLSELRGGNEAPLGNFGD